MVIPAKNFIFHADSVLSVFTFQNHVGILFTMFFSFLVALNDNPFESRFSVWFFPADTFALGMNSERTLRACYCHSLFTCF